MLSFSIEVYPFNFSATHITCIIQHSRVTPPVEEEGADVDEAIEAGGIAVLGHLERSCTSLRLTVVASIAPIIEKWSDKGKGTKKWHKILVIAEGKINLSRVAESLYISMIERMK